MRADAYGLLWQDEPTKRAGGPRVLGPMPPIPETGWLPPKEYPLIRDDEWISLDCETWDPELDDCGPGWGRHKGHIVGVSLASPRGKWYFPIRHEVQPELNLDPATTFRYLNWALGGNCPKLGANLIYDIGWLEEEGVTVNGELLDAQFAEALLSETSKVNLDALGMKYLRERKESDLLKEWIMAYYRPPEDKWRREIYRSPITLTGPYAEQDAALPQRVLKEQWSALVFRGLVELFKMECGLIRLLIKMRMAGVAVNIPYAEEIKHKFNIRCEELTKEAGYLVGGMDINVNAGDSLAKAFDYLGLRYYNTAPTEAFPDGKPSFTKAFLENIRHPFAEKVMEIKGLKKLNSTFVQSYLLDSHVNGKVHCSFHPLSGTEGGARTGRFASSDPNLQNIPVRTANGKVHCSFHPLSGTEGGARTGRFASSDPNLQNIPVRTAEGKMIRAAFTMDDGHLQVRDYDYSQIEYRMLAHYATGRGADEVRQKYWTDPDLDYHVMVQEMIKQMTGLDIARSYVKNINFGIVYGLGLRKLAEIYLKISYEKAKEFKQAFDTAVPFAKDTMEATIAEVNKSGIVTTILGRQSHFDEWEPIEWALRTEPMSFGDARRMFGIQIMRAYLYRAINYRLQGSAADIMKMGMYKCWKDGVFDVTGVPRLTVHDELFFSDPGGKEEAFKEMQHIFETCVPCRVPIRFDNGVGPNWGVAH